MRHQVKPKQSLHHKRPHNIHGGEGCCDGKKESLEQLLANPNPILDQMQECIVILDLEGNIKSWNQGAQQKFGYLPAEIITQPCTRLFLNPTFNFSQAILHPVLHQGHYACDQEIRTKYDEAFPAHISFSNLKNANGDIIGIITYLTEIKTEKDTETKLLQQLNKEREQTKQLLSFISMISHELRTPLSTILSSTDLLDYYAQSCTDQEKQDFFRQIRESVHRMTSFLHDTLLIHQSENFLEFNPVPLALDQFCTTLVKELQQNIKTNHQIQLILDEAPIDGVMDQDLLRHIFSNLISNAVKYTPQGGRIKFKLINQGENVIFSVQDSGIGIPDNAKDLLFQSSYRADNVGNIAGTGLGLAIVKQLVDIHQGNITVDSQLNSGTIFTLTLPRAASRKHPGA